MSDALTPPGQELELVPPQPVTVVAPERAATLVPVDDAVVEQLKQQAGQVVGELVALDHRAPTFSGKVGAISALGDKEIRAAAQTSNRMLERPVRAMDQKGLLSDGSPVGQGLVELRHTIEDLDPSEQNLLSKRKLFGVLPFGDRLRTYFDKYQSAQKQLDSIIETLLRGQDELRMDNAAIEQEKASLWATMGRLQQFALMADELDRQLEARIADLDATDPEKANALRQDVLFQVRQKHQDLLTQLAVSVQGYLALDLVRKNNLELIKGVDRATTTTVAALRTAVTVAQALANQKLVLDQIGALNRTTGNMIESTGRMLRDQSAQIQQQAASATIDLDQLKGAFVNVFAALDSVDTYRLQALGGMRQTVEALEGEVVKARGYLERAAPGAEPPDPLRLPPA